MAGRLFAVRYPVYYSQPADTNPFQAVGFLEGAEGESQSQGCVFHAISSKKMGPRFRRAQWGIAFGLVL